MKEPVSAEEEGVVDGVVVVGSAVVLHMEAERGKLRVLPEIEAARDLKISTTRSIDLILGILRVVVIVHEEEGVTPFVPVETLKSGGHVTAVLTEIVEGLKVGLGLCS